MPPTLPVPLGELIPRGFLIDPQYLVVGGGAVGDLLEIVSGSPPIAQFVPPLHRIAGLVFPFGNGLSSLSSGEYIEVPLPFGMELEYWHLRLDDIGDAAFTIEAAPSIAAALAPVGGTQPSVTGLRGTQNIGGLDWTTTTMARGGVIRATLNSSAVTKQATLVISGKKLKPGP